MIGGNSEESSSSSSSSSSSGVVAVVGVAAAAVVGVVDDVGVAVVVVDDDDDVLFRLLGLLDVADGVLVVVLLVFVVLVAGAGFAVVCGLGCLAAAAAAAAAVVAVVVAVGFLRLLPNAHPPSSTLLAGLAAVAVAVAAVFGLASRVDLHSLHVRLVVGVLVPAGFATLALRAALATAVDVELLFDHVSQQDVQIGAGGPACRSILRKTQPGDPVQ
eukprot:CAMPEP_0206563794 /NCGR_PEP_ID=MMETSP0325_2-20121206/23066_1 /ASSEMBLY_ACC=CAM_ASM_000347 /TAXON_ID=2866 /ORGANISM="Crypthecodinium cohnii, Strain Seligo" /LENGTH=215 /DNA_ID=CAMNT_0054066283 /DNA_START=1 /DNA_END=649 /DNA_ORIENTATION=+